MAERVSDMVAARKARHHPGPPRPTQASLEHSASMEAARQAQLLSRSPAPPALGYGHGLMLPLETLAMLQPAGAGGPLSPGMSPAAYLVPEQAALEEGEAGMLGGWGPRTAAGAGGGEERTSKPPSWVPLPWAARTQALLQSQQQVQSAVMAALASPAPNITTRRRNGNDVQQQQQQQLWQAEGEAGGVWPTQEEEEGGPTACFGEGMAAEGGLGVDDLLGLVGEGEGEGLVREGEGEGAGEWEEDGEEEWEWEGAGGMEGEGTWEAAEESSSAWPQEGGEYGVEDEDDGAAGRQQQEEQEEAEEVGEDQSSSFLVEGGGARAGQGSFSFQQQQ